MKSQPYFQKQQRSLYELKRTHAKDYSKLLSIGYQDKSATERLKHDIGRASLIRLKDRVILAQNSFGVTGVSLDGIKETAEVKEYINHLEQSDIAKKGAGSLHLIHPKIYRRY
jgi:hypothetical protein